MPGKRRCVHCLQQVIRSRAGDAARFVATSRYYANHMAAYLGADPAGIDVVYTGVPRDYLDEPRKDPSRSADDPPTQITAANYSF